MIVFSHWMMTVRALCGARPRPSPRDPVPPGQKIATELFNTFAADPARLLPDRDAHRWKQAKGNEDQPHRVICDYVAGITDEYATKRYQQLFSPRIGSVFDRL